MAYRFVLHASIREPDFELKHLVDPRGLEPLTF